MNSTKRIRPTRATKVTKERRPALSSGGDAARLDASIGEVQEYGQLDLLAC
jgi:hypothetical protein